MLRYTKNMMRPVEVSISPAEKEIDPTLVRRLITLFDRSDLREDKDGYKIVMRASESAMEYFFDVEKLGYLKYKLMNVVRLKNMYSIRLFIIASTTLISGSGRFRLKSCVRYCVLGTLIRPSKSSAGMFLILRLRMCLFRRT